MSGPRAEDHQGLVDALSVAIGFLRTGGKPSMRHQHRHSHVLQQIAAGRRRGRRRDVCGDACVSRLAGRRLAAVSVVGGVFLPFVQRHSSPGLGHRFTASRSAARFAPAMRCSRSRRASVIGRPPSSSPLSIMPDFRARSLSTPLHLRATGVAPNCRSQYPSGSAKWGGNRTFIGARLRALAAGTVSCQVNLVAARRNELKNRRERPAIWGTSAKSTGDESC